MEGNEEKGTKKALCVFFFEEERIAGGCVNLYKSRILYAGFVDISDRVKLGCLFFQRVCQFSLKNCRTVG